MIFCSTQPVLTSSQSAYHMLQNNVIAHVFTVCTFQVQEGRTKDREQLSLCH